MGNNSNRFAPGIGCNYVSLPGGALVADDGSVYFRQHGDHFVVKAHQLSPSQVEFSAKKPVFYLEGTEDDLTDLQRACLRRIRSGDGPHETEDEKAEREARNIKTAANRAKTQVRKWCKVIAADSLLTLTYRENQTDLDLTKKHLREFVRRLRRVFPDFRGVATFEQQKRGAWHVHIAVPRMLALVSYRGESRVKSFNVIRAIWRGVVGRDNGTINLQNRRFHSKRSPAKIAAYLSKYIVKAFADGRPESNRWTRFGDMDMPPILELGKAFDPARMLGDVYGMLGEGFTVACDVFSKFGDWFFMAAELPQNQKVKI